MFCLRQTFREASHLGIPSIWLVFCVHIELVMTAAHRRFLKLGIYNYIHYGNISVNTELNNTKVKRELGITLLMIRTKTL